MSCRYSLTLPASLHPPLLEALAVGIGEDAHPVEEVVIPLTFEFLPCIEIHHSPAVLLVVVELASMHASVGGGGEDAQSLAHILEEQRKEEKNITSDQFFLHS